MGGYGFSASVEGKRPPSPSDSLYVALHFLFFYSSDPFMVTLRDYDAYYVLSASFH